jgi:carbon-monoxide dehydrogenase medium subunit
VKAARFDYARPERLDQAVAMLGGEGARPFAGGQSLGPMLNLRLARPAALVDIARLAELRHVEERPDGVFFGAGITHAEFEDGAVPDPTGGVLASVARGIAYRAVRNRGTVGGSLAHADPAADWPTTLSALGASVHLAGPGGRRELAVEDFLHGAFQTALAPGEIIVGVFVPRLSASARWGYRKSCRKAGEFAEAMCAVLVDSARNICRLAIGAIEGKPIVLTAADAYFANPELIDPYLAQAGLAADPATLDLHRAVIRKAITAMDAWRPPA